MLRPDVELALGILDALDNRDVSGVVACRDGQPTGERAWFVQECRMIDGILSWLERQNHQSRHDVALQQAIMTLCDRLEIAKGALQRYLADLDTAAEREWKPLQRKGERQAVAPPEQEREENDLQGVGADRRAGARHLRAPRYSLGRAD